jgi:hypothetical protein
MNKHADTGFILVDLKKDGIRHAALAWLALRLEVVGTTKCLADTTGSRCPRRVGACSEGSRMPAPDIALSRFAAGTAAQYYGTFVNFPCSIESET